jgi:hypothetical protein
MVRDEISSQLIVDKLSDPAVLRNACEFAGLHRALVVKHLWATLPAPDEANELRSVALELTMNYVAALEDAVLWFFVLREWKSGNKLLFDLLDTIQITESRKAHYSSQAALEVMEAWTIADLRREFGLPGDEWLLAHGWSKTGVNRHISAIRESLERLKKGLELRVGDEGVLCTSYNKIKHGCLAIAATEHSSIGVSVMMSSRRGPKGEKGKRMINTGWLPCEKEELEKVAHSTLLISEAIWTLLNLLYMVRFDAEWRLPQWPVPSLVLDND